MANKVFVSYKYWDDSVYQDQSLDKICEPRYPMYNSDDNCKVTPRSYLNAMSDLLDGYVIAKWEQDDEDLSKFKDETIESKLKDKIYDSSITIVLISPRMNSGKAENDQWIPWEISYSLKNVTRKNRTSSTNAILAIVLPDSKNSYSYCISDNNNCNVDTLRFSSPFCFNIIST